MAGFTAGVGRDRPCVPVRGPGGWIFLKNGLLFFLPNYREKRVNVFIYKNPDLSGPLLPFPLKNADRDRLVPFLRL
jgi:hypothetical protein